MLDFLLFFLHENRIRFFFRVHFVVSLERFFGYFPAMKMKLTYAKQRKITRVQKKIE